MSEKLVKTKFTQRKSSSEESISSEEASGSSGSSSCSESESEVDTTETSFSSKSIVEAIEPHGVLKFNHKNYAVVCEPVRKHHHKHHHEELLKKDIDANHFEHKYDKEHVHKSKKKRKIPPISVCVLNCRYDIIPRIAKNLGYKLVGESDLWTLCWTDSLVGVDFCRDMRRFQKINHFPGMFEICRKDLLARNMNRMLKLFPLEYQIFPKTWCFPADLGDAVAYARTHRSKTFILKPDQGSQGRGIFLTKNLKELNPKERMICQVYIHKPLLIDGYKFDLRVYTLITSTDPLRIFVYNEGLARFATNKYKEPCVTNASNNFMHLTNYSVNKYSRAFSNDDEIGSKRRFSTLNRILTSEGYDIAELWTNVDDVIVKTILSAWPMLKHTYNASFPTHDIMQACFEILGFDIIIDQKMKPLILEVNHSPSFHTDEVIDKEIKEALIRDTFTILNLNAEVKKKVMEEDRRRIQNRLLQRLRDYPKFKDSPSAEPKNEEVDPITDVPISKWAAQIQWEETHLGGFRRIMPSPGDPERYLPFFLVQSQASVYNETAASKRREECAKQQRIELEERFKMNQAILHKTYPKFHHSRVCAAEDGVTMTKTTKKKKKLKKIKKRDAFSIELIAEYEERERVALLAQRDFLIRTCGLVQTIYLNFNKNKLLTESDRRKYKDTYAKLLAAECLEPLPAPPPQPVATQQSSSVISTSLPSLSSSNTCNTVTQSSSVQNQKLQIAKLIPFNDSTSWMQCNEMPVTARPPLPYLLASTQPPTYRSTKTTMARQVTNVVKRHSIDTRQYYTSDKII